jgi:hypothetical protein
MLMPVSSVAAQSTNRKLARTVSWSTTMASVTYGIEAMYEDQQWIGDQIQKVIVSIAKDTAGLKATTAECNTIRSADIPPMRAILDRRTERHFMRFFTQKNSNSSFLNHKRLSIVTTHD